MDGRVMLERIKARRGLEEWETAERLTAIAQMDEADVKEFARIAGLETREEKRTKVVKIRTLSFISAYNVFVLGLPYMDD